MFLEGEPEALAEVLSLLDQGFWLCVGLWASEAPVWPDWCSASGHFSNLHSGSLELSQHHVLLYSSSFDLSRLHSSHSFFFHAFLALDESSLHLPLQCQHDILHGGSSIDRRTVTLFPLFSFVIRYLLFLGCSFSYSGGS